MEILIIVLALALILVIIQNNKITKLNKENNEQRKLLKDMEKRLNDTLQDKYTLTRENTALSEINESLSKFKIEKLLEETPKTEKKATTKKTTAKKTTAKKAETKKTTTKKKQLKQQLIRKQRKRYKNVIK